LIIVDSQRYVNVEQDYQYFKCRSVSDYKGGAAGDKIDRNHKKSSNVKYYKNFENQLSMQLKRGYRKVHQDAE
jgi:hypothetical protein